MSVAGIPTQADCCQICHRTPRCVGWVYGNDKVYVQKKAASLMGISLVGGPGNPQPTHSAGLMKGVSADSA